MNWADYITLEEYINLQSMENLYPSLMPQGDPNDPSKGYDMPSIMSQDEASYYHNMQYHPLYGLEETYPAYQGAQQVTLNQVGDYPMLQSSQMHGNTNCMQPSHQSQPMQPSHQSQPLMQNSLPSQTDEMLMASIVSPLTNTIKTEPLNMDNLNVSSPSPKSHSSSYEFSAESGDDKSQVGEKDDKAIVRLKKRPLSVPDEQKDGSYWEKRKKNNESAKRSREARRLKEEQIALKMFTLQQDNIELKAQVRLLKSDVKQLQDLLYG